MLQERVILKEIDGKKLIDVDTNIRIQKETKINSKLKPKMSKQTKFTILGLIALLVISVVLNISQLTASGSDVDKVMQDSLAAMCKKDSIKSDSLKSFQDSINGLNQKISKIKETLKK